MGANTSIQISCDEEFLCETNSDGTITVTVRPGANIEAGRKYFLRLCRENVNTSNAVGDSFSLPNIHNGNPTAYNIKMDRYGLPMGSICHFEIYYEYSFFFMTREHVIARSPSFKYVSRVYKLQEKQSQIKAQIRELEVEYNKIAGEIFSLSGVRTEGLYGERDYRRRESNVNIKIVNNGRVGDDDVEEEEDEEETPVKEERKKKRARKG